MPLLPADKLLPDYSFVQGRRDLVQFTEGVCAPGYTEHYPVSGVFIRARCMQRHSVPTDPCYPLKEKPVEIRVIVEMTIKNEGYRPFFSCGLSRPNLHNSHTIIGIKEEKHYEQEDFMNRIVIFLKTC